MKKTIFIICLLIGFGSIQAQDEQSDYQKRYNGAKLFFTQGNYALAMEAFKPLIQADENNPYATYASFYYALSAYREGYLPMAKNMLLQIKQLYPKWSKLNEVNIWLSNIYFENEEYNSALNVLKEADDKGQKEFVSSLKQYHLNKIKSLSTLKNLYENNDDEAVLAQVLAKRISAQPLAERDQELLESLILKFDLDNEALNVPVITKSVFKEEYKVAVMLPFMVETLEPVDKRQVNYIVLDFYQGLQLAVDSLKSIGINIKLFAYDTKRDSTETANILAKDELKGMDLIVGPLYSHTTSLVSEFAYKNQINVINPFFSDSDITGNNPFSFLYKPSSESVGSRVANFVKDRVRNKVGIIFYGDFKRDSVLAYTYKHELEKDSFNIIITKKIERDSSRAILDLLLISDEKIKEAATEEAREKFTIGIDSVGHIFVASSNDLISSKVISAVETRGDSITVIGSADWMELPAINYDAYGRLNAILYAPGYTIQDTLGYEQFREKYVKRHKKSPSKFTEDGYEVMMLAGHSLYQYGKYFQIGWDQVDYLPGFISLGYDYRNSNNNKLVPVLSFEGEEMRIYLNREGTEDEDREQ